MFLEARGLTNGCPVMEQTLMDMIGYIRVD